MTILYWLDRIQPPDRPLVGEKAFVSSQLKQQGYPIPEGFVILNATFQEFFETLNDSESILADFPHSSLYLDVNDSKILQVVARESRRAILQATLPPQWQSELTEAVKQLKTEALIWRFSLPARVAGRSTGLLASRCSRTEPNDLESALKNAWAELFTARSLFYWRKMGISLETVRLALLVQPLIDASRSGISFIEPYYWQIQATVGLGKSLITGEISPDCYTIDRSSGKPIHQQLGNKTRAYYLDLHSPSESPVSAHIPPRSEQENFSLKDNDIDRLVQLLQSLLTEKPSLTSLQWLISADSQLYLLNCHSAGIPVLSSPSLSLKHSPLKGLAVSPGIVTGIVQIVTTFDSPSPQNLQGSILVTHHLPPRILPHLRHLKGIITEQGGIASHGAILARELGIPAIVGVEFATRILKSGETILLNGTLGIISLSPVVPSLPLVSHPVSPATDTVSLVTRLMVNLSQTGSINRVQSLPIDGVGLLRSEWMILELLSRRSLEEWLQNDRKEEFVRELAHLIEKFATSFAPRPVFYRSLDEVVSYKSREQALERRGTYRYLLDPTLFDLELQALRRVQIAGSTNLNLILPFVRGVGEFSFCRERVQSALLTQVPSFQLWIMAEVPSVLFQLQAYVRAGVQGIAIGTNDLTQFLLGIDRDYPHSEHFNARHPALLFALEYTIQQAKLLNIPCSLCGQAIVQCPDIIDDLVKWGITTLSVDPESVISTRKAIIRAEQRLLFKEISS